MMKKIINWTFGSFFRTLGRIFVYILLAILISYLLKDFKMPKIDIWQVLDVYAYDASTWLQDTQPIEEADFYNWSSSSSYSHLTTNTQTTTFYLNDKLSDTYLETTRNYYYTPVINLGSNGVSFVIKLPTALTSNFLYNVNMYLCGANAPSPYSTNALRVGSSYTNALTSNPNYSYLTRVSLGSSINDNQEFSNAFPYCYMYSGFVTPSVNGAYASFRLNGTDNSSYAVVGVNVEALGNDNGLTSSDISNVISNSGLATASSITEVQSSVNQVQQELSEVNSSIEEQIQADEQNTQDIIDNQNANSQAQIDSQKVCKLIDKNMIKIDNKYLNGNGLEENITNFGITDFISINAGTIENIQTYEQNWSIYSCYYNVNKELISCFKNQNMINTIPENASYIRLSINKTLNKPQFKLCQNGNQAMSDYLNDDNTSESTSSASNFFNNFNTNTHGLTGIITAPLSAIQSLTSSSCSPLVLPLPFVNQNLTLPCMRDIYTQFFGDFMQLYDIITLGIISYWVMVRIFALVKDFKNPEHDEIEVVDL